ncbi:hypothetical protein JWG42_01205 [Desulfoprunum benzoelyticum]|uniref:Uncharacterized protein n=1 Tax=Desulfoprunum benzoelyticum TaxID=1506996 RepID=A0A840V0G2_9BACT|nr:hypothetical protein [Desulfoprunum benzoelyticum]MBB5348368.1 hypothetical protein [Desulfoprunum benzoelyticum]MBM9528773.1 hypothetical protein [Desulfoprunum benzoelyticum]
MGFDFKESRIDALSFGSKLLGEFPDIFRCAYPVEHKVDNVYKERLEQQGHCPSHEQGVDSLPGDVSDIIAADITAHACVYQQHEVRDAAENEVAEPIQLFEDKREKVKMKYRKEQHQYKPLVKATFQSYFEKVEGPFQRKEFSRYVLAFAFNDEKLLDFGNGIEEIPGPVYPAAIGRDNLGIGIILPLILPFPAHQFS